MKFRSLFLFTISILLLLSCSNDDTPIVPENPISEEPTPEEPTPEEPVNSAPNSFGLLTLENNLEGADLMPTLTWSAAIDPDNDNVVYDFYFGDSETTLIKIAEDLIVSEFTISEELSVNTTFFWKVIAKDNKGGETESEMVFSFTTLDIGLAAEALTGAKPFMPRSGHQTVTFQEKIWVIGGYGQFTNLSDGDVWSSTNGIDYVLENKNAFSQPVTDHTCVVFNNKIWLFDSSGLGDILSSINGKDWITEVEDAPFFARENHSVTVWNNKLWVIGGYEPYQDGASLDIKEKNDVWSSEDGINWVLVTEDAGFPVRRGHSTVVFQNQLYLFGGSGLDRGTSTPYVRNDIWTSTDGENWTEVNATNLFEGRTGETAFVFQNRIWLIAGRVLETNETNPDNLTYVPKNDVWYTEDGINWFKQAENLNFGARFNHSSTVFNDKAYIMAGYYVDEITSAYRNDIWVLE